MGATSYVALLSCTHTVILNPSPRAGDIVWCRRCGAYRTVTVGTAEWTVHCPTCRWGRAYGSDKAGCRRTAVRHQERFPTHTVFIKKAGKVIDRLDPVLPDPIVT